MERRFPAHRTACFDFSAEDGQDRSGLKALINSAVVSHKRMPMLDVIFDRTARLMSTSLRQLTNENIEVTLDNVSSVRFGEFIQAQSAAGVIGVIHSKSFDGYALLAADSPLVHSVVDLLLGGRRSSGTGVEGRALTAIELGLAERMLKTLIDDFGEAFAPVADAAFALDRVETTPRFAAIAQDASVCTLAKFKIRLEEMTTRATILVPHAMIEPVREKLLCDIGESGAADEIWKRRLGAGVSASGVELAAVLADRSDDDRRSSRFENRRNPEICGQCRRAGRASRGRAVRCERRVGRMGELVAVKIDAALAKPKRNGTGGGGVNIGVILDIVLIVLLVAGAAGGFYINGRLQRLTTAQEELKAAIAHFDEAALRAEGAMKRLEAGGLAKSAELQAAALRAETLVTELSVMSSAGERIADRIESVLGDVRSLGRTRASEKSRRAA
ncbi:MAG: DUF6468 domain-containing protein [Parvularculaceae bacterium]